MNNRFLKKVVFLDRDGVINRDSPDYIKSWAEFHFLPGSITAIKNLTDKGFAPIIITNQSAVNRHLITEKKLADIHAKMKAAIRYCGGEIKDIFFCPHTPEESCNCRKPKPGLIHEAQRKYEIDLAAAAMIGDNSKDIECARNAECAYAGLVKTGNGIEAEKTLAAKNILPDFVAHDLHQAAKWLISQQK